MEITERNKVLSLQRAVQIESKLEKQHRFAVIKNLRSTRFNNCKLYDQITVIHEFQRSEIIQNTSFHVLFV